MSESTETTAAVAMNRTGMAMAEGAEELEKLVDEFVPVGEPEEFHRARAEGRVGAPSIGTTPPPTSFLGIAKEALRAIMGAPEHRLLDKLSERLAFERTGTRLYDTLLEKFDQDGAFEGGPTRAQLEHIRDDEAAHFRMLERTIRELDGDPTAVSPSADLAAVASSGILAVVVDARTRFPEALEAMLMAELIDSDGWSRLVELALHLGKDDLADRFQAAESAEDDHVVLVRGWVAARAARPGAAD
jgi:rubrerythrin